MASANSANRFSTYSGAPSIHPSIAPTTSSTAVMSSNPVDSARNGLSPNTALKVSATTYSSDSVPMRSTSNASSNDARNVDIKSWAAAIDRMSDSRLDRQRFTLTGTKGDEISTNALGAKLERALGRRMSGQDAIFTRRPKQLSEKRSVEVAAQ